MVQKTVKSGVVVKSVGGVFSVLCDDGMRLVCYSPKKFRYDSKDVVVGDKVCVQDIRQGKGVITEILPRKNKLNRPEIANVDVCFVVVACQPQPDLMLADKILINCFQQRIEPIVVVNKTDLPSDTEQIILQNYRDIAKTVNVSALDGSATELLRFIAKGVVACFAGQSAVGKTSLLNALLPQANGKVGNLSEKSGRGMHTTRHSALYRAGDGFVADTCGFSLCDLTDIRSEQLHLYLDDFVRLSAGCKFTSCTHTAEPDCAVKRAVEQGTLCRDRYDRYLKQFEELKQREKAQY